MLLNNIFMICCPEPFHLKGRLMNLKSLMPMFKTSPFDWLNNDVSF